MEQSELQRAVVARDARASALLAHPAVQAVGVGASLDNPGEPAIEFFVTRGASHAGIPAEVNGIRTRIVEGDLFAKRGAEISAADSATNEARGSGAAAGVFDFGGGDVAREHGEDGARERIDEDGGCAGRGRDVERRFAGRSGADDFCDSRRDAGADSAGDRWVAHARARIEPVPCGLSRLRARGGGLPGACGKASAATKALKRFP